jgi:DNA-binding NtrC family response regulator
MRVLVVDDDPIVLESCRRIFESENIEAVLSTSAKEALERLSEKTFDLMLVDVIMPEYDGIYLMGSVRERWPKMPVIVMSGYPTPEVMAKGKRAGAFFFIAKPFDPGELLDAVRTVADKIKSEEDHDGQNESASHRR